MAVAERPDVDEAEDTRERVVVWDTGEVLYVHPVASLFPMMSDEELDDLAADIKANGLIHPIVLDQHRQLTDGRNRLEACRRAGVSPDFIVVAVHDPVAFILSANVGRRHLTKSQTAMAVCRAKFFTGEKLEYGDQGVLAGRLGVSQARLSQASTVLKFAPEYADAVLFRGMPLREAYEKAQERKAAAQSDEARLQALKVEAPELAELVVDERLTLAGALAELQERRRKAREQEEKDREYRALTTRQLDSALSFLDPRQVEPRELAGSLLRHFEPAAVGAAGGLTAERLAACAAVLTAMAAAISEEQEG